MDVPFLLFLNLVVHDSRLQTPEALAIAYLAREVPRWHTKNNCYSCHNNGDAAHALYLAKRQSYRVPDGVLEDTTLWLSHPEKWNHNPGDPGFSDKSLERIQFAAAYLSALEAGVIKDRKPLLRAAERMAADQKDDGCWKIAEEANIGSPTTYGACLATWQALRVLKNADPEQFEKRIARAERWLRAKPVENVLHAAGILLAVEREDDEAARAKKEQCLELIKRGEAKQGGWGPYVNAFPEPFDTAVVLLALSGRPAHRDMTGRGRAYLIRTQRADGSWIETTRPAGAQSYAQRISTSAWATIALLTTRPRLDSERKTHNKSTVQN
jgi:hypothetical protein